MCGGGGQDTFVVKYQKGFSGQTGGTVIPTRNYADGDQCYSSSGSGTYTSGGSIPAENDIGENGYGQRSTIRTFSEHVAYYYNDYALFNSNTPVPGGNNYLITFEWEYQQLGGSAVVTNGNSVTINNTTNVWGAVS